MFNQPTEYSQLPIIQATIVGFGNTGRAILSNLLHHKDHVIEINVMDPSDRITGSIMDLSHSCTIDKRHKIYVNDVKRFNQAQYVFFAAGKAIPLGLDRTFQWSENIEIAHKVFADFSPINDPLVIVITNPNDLITGYLHHFLQGRVSQVVGTGTFVDTLRFEFLLSQLLNCELHEVSAWIIGQHGDAMVPVLSHTYVKGHPIQETVPNDLICDAIYETRRAAHRIKETQTATFYAVAKCATYVMESHLSNNGQIIPLSLFDESVGVSYSRPMRFVDGKIQVVSDFNLNEEEREGLDLALQKLNLQHALIT